MPRSASRWILPTMFLAFTPGCALLGAGGHEGGTATLTEAAAEADSSRKHRRLDVGYTTPPPPPAEVEAGSTASQFEGGGEGAAATTTSTAQTEPPHTVFGAVVGIGTIGGERYDGFGQFGLTLGAFVEPNFRFDIAGLFLPIQFADETIAGQSFKNEFELALDISGRYYLTKGNTFIGVYPIVGFSFATLFWDYNHPVTVVEDDGTREVRSDYINLFSIYGGVGMSLVQIRHMHIGSNLTGGARLYSVDSSNGFSNTLFPDAGFVQLRFELSFRN
jgi:hypothetical protein